MTDMPPSDVSLKRIMIGAMVGGCSSYCLTQLSLHGVDFKELGVDSEIVKGAITATITGYAMAPILIIYKIRDAILWVGNAKQIIKDALNGKKSNE